MAVNLLAGQGEAVPARPLCRLSILRAARILPDRRARGKSRA